MHDTEGETRGDGCWAAAHLDPDLHRLESLAHRGSNESRLLDVPLHAGLAVHPDRDPGGDELLLLRAFANGEGPQEPGTDSGREVLIRNLHCDADRGTAGVDRLLAGIDGLRHVRGDGAAVERDRRAYPGRNRPGRT